MARHVLTLQAASLDGACKAPTRKWQSLGRYVIQSLSNAVVEAEQAPSSLLGVKMTMSDGEDGGEDVSERR